MKNTLIRALALALAMMLLLPAAFAKDSSGLQAEYDALRQREEHIQLELQILELEKQRASLMKNDAAVQAANDQQTALENELKTIAQTKEDLALELLEAIQAEEKKLLSALEMISSELTACSERTQQLDELYLRYLSELFSLGGLGTAATEPIKLPLAGLEAEYEKLQEDEQLLRIDLQINDLRLQQAQVQQNQAALAEAETARATLLTTQQALLDRKCTVVNAILSSITADKDATYARQNALLTEARALEDSLRQLSDDFAWLAEAAEMAKLRQSIADIFPGSTAEEIAIAPGTHPAVAMLYRLTDAAGQLAGWYIRTTASGYAGPVVMTFAIDAKGQVTQAIIGDSTFVETAGFGQRWLDEERTAQFTRLNTRQDGVIETVTGATFTSNAVLKATNAAFNCINDLSGSDKRNPVVFGKLEWEIPVVSDGGLFHASAKGFQSLVNVSLSVDDAGRIQQLQIDTSKETAGFGGAVMNKRAFVSQFEGKTGPFQNVDGISGATITSDAVVTAVNAAWEAAVQNHPALQTATAKGFQSDVKAQLLRDEQQRITVLLIDTSGETMGFGTRVMENEAFRQQFIGKTIPVDGVDAVSGATITSRAVANAVNSIKPPKQTSYTFEFSISREAAFLGIIATAPLYCTVTLEGDVITDIHLEIRDIHPDSSMSSSAVSIQLNPDEYGGEAFLNQFIGRAGPFHDIEPIDSAPLTTDILNAINSIYSSSNLTANPFVLSASAKGLLSDVTVYVMLSDNGAIAAIAVDCSGETQAIARPCTEDAFLRQFIGRTGPFSDIDVVSGATFTSNAVINAINSLYSGH